MSKNTKVSIIMPCYNHGLYIEEALNSVFASDYDNYEVIVIDDGSTDELTKSVLSKISHPLVKIIYKEHNGPSAARNAGIKAAEGEYILPLDADDKIDKTFIRKAVKILDENANIGLVYSEAETFGEENLKIEFQEYDNDINFYELLVSNKFMISSFFRKKDFEKIGGYKDELKEGLEDWELWISLCSLGIKTYKIPETLFFYRKRKYGNLSSKTANCKLTYWKNFKEIIKLHPTLYIDNLEKILPDLMFVALGVISMDVKIKKAKIFLFRALKPKNLFNTFRKIRREKVNVLKCLLAKK